MCIFCFIRVLISDCENKRDSLCMSYVQPHKEGSGDTIAHWIRSVMCVAGVETAIFKVQRVRSASVSKSTGNFVPVDGI